MAATLPGERRHDAPRMCASHLIPIARQIFDYRWVASKVKPAGRIEPRRGVGVRVAAKILRPHGWLTKRGKCGGDERERGVEGATIQAQAGRDVAGGGGAACGRAQARVGRT